jgi:hypothetical protein
MNNDPLAFLGQLTQFPPNSRYYKTEIATLTTTEGETVAYLRRRFVPQPETFTTLQDHRVQEGERLDLIAARYLGDPEQYWKICDANAAMIPSDLTETPGRTLHIAMPEGVTGGGASNA